VGRLKTEVTTSCLRCFDVIRDTRQQNTRLQSGQINLHQFLMLLQTLSYWDKQQSADCNIIQLHLTLKCTIDQASHLQCLFRSFELNLSPPKLRSDKISCRIRATTDVCRHKQLPLPGRQNQQPSLSCISGNTECRQEGL